MMTSKTKDAAGTAPRDQKPHPIIHGPEVDIARRRYLDAVATWEMADAGTLREVQLYHLMMAAQAELLATVKGPDYRPPHKERDEGHEDQPSV